MFTSLLSASFWCTLKWQINTMSRVANVTRAKFLDVLDSQETDIREGKELWPSIFF